MSFLICLCRFDAGRGQRPLVAPIFYDAAPGDYKGGVFEQKNKEISERNDNHMTLLVGWDDFKKAWLIKNS